MTLPVQNKYILNTKHLHVANSTLISSENHNATAFYSRNSIISILVDSNIIVIDTGIHYFKLFPLRNIEANTNRLSDIKLPRLSVGKLPLLLLVKDAAAAVAEVNTVIDEYFTWHFSITP